MAIADAAAVIQEIDELLDRADLGPDDHPTARDFENLGTSTVYGLLASWSAAIERFAAPKSAYVEQARAIVKSSAFQHGKAVRLHGVLLALRADYEAGHLRAIEELIHADVFGDFLDMADELQKKGYKDPAAVITGAVLEEHLRKLAEASGVQVAVAGRPKKADTINADLTKAGVYNKLEQKNVTAWMGLRNDAAHGQFESYDVGQVVLLIQSVREFLTRYPA